MITFLAAPLGLLHRARRAAALLAILTVVGMGVAYGVQPFSWLISQLPLLRSIKNARLIVVGSFGVAGLAGLGISTLEKEILFSMRKRLCSNRGYVFGCFSPPCSLSPSGSENPRFQGRSCS